MTVRARVAGSVGGLLFLLVAARTSAAADQEATLQQITSLNKAAITAYSAGDFDKSKTQLLQAVALGKKDPELQTHPLMARTYVHLGVLYVDGFEDRAEGIRYFVKALKIRPDIDVTSALATKSVKSAFEEARTGASPAGATAVASKEAASAKEHAAEGKKAAESSDDAGEEEEAPAPKMTAAEKRKAAAEEKKAAAEEKKRAAAEAKEEAAAEKRAAKESKEKDKQAGAEKDKLMKELAQAQGNEAKERGAKEKLQTEKAEKEKQLADTKAALDQLQKESKEKDKQAQAERDKLAKELAALKDSEAKERAAKEKLQTEKAEKEKQLADAKGSIAQLQKEKADKEKQLADTTTREQKERDAKEKLEKEKQLADARDKERKAQEEKARQEREKLAAGPDLPSHIPEPLYCVIPDDAPAGTELFVHCAPRSEVKGGVVAFYYRPSGSVHYNSLAMEHSKKGWYTALIPGDQVNGKLLQHYAEVRDGHGTVVAATGKSNSPNILTLHSGAGDGSGPKTTTAGRAAPKSKGR